MNTIQVKSNKKSLQQAKKCKDKFHKNNGKQQEHNWHNLERRINKIKKKLIILLDKKTNN